MSSKLLPLHFSLNFQVGDSIYKAGVTWNAENNIADARRASNTVPGRNRPDIWSWWCDNDGGGVLGRAFLGTLCTWSNININEKMKTYAASAFVSKI